ncbi:uncharacterized protein LOC121999544 [Zingiber officinale]|uniref:uncharacterized protein LOC121999544 n=1 Tax=Zingiber officinale TaxID=94328 RepID=UPI001C4AD947|nr:uncharacterized protein LOC121999544 [Zingiber officinale]
MEDSGRINVTMTAGEYELFKEAKKRAASEKQQTTASRPKTLPEVSKEPAHASGWGSKRKQPLEFPPAFYRELGQGYYQPEPRYYSHKEQPQVSVDEKRLPKGYRPPSIGEYDGSKDPEDHLRKFRNAALLHQYSDVVKCRVFLNTLSGFAQKWFDGLPHGSITCFSDFKIVFLRHFASSRRYQKMDHCLFALKQGSPEPLRSYIKRFNQVAQDVPSATSEILMSAFSHRLTEGEFFRDLIRNPVRNFDEMLEKVTSYIDVEEVQAARRKVDKLPPSTNRPERRAPQPPTQPLPCARDARPTFHPGQDARPTFHPSQDARLVPCVAVVQVPRPGPWGPRYYTYPWSHTHATSDCVQFMQDSRRVAELGLPPPELAPQVQRMMEERRNAVGQAGRPRAEKGGPSMS